MNEQIEEGEESGYSIRAEQAPLATRRLTLRHPRMADAAAITALANNLRVAEQSRRMPYPFTLDDAESWIAAVRRPSPDSESAFLITGGDDGVFLGVVGYAPREDGGDVEIGYWLGEPHWGHGYATEAAQAVIDHAFTQGAFERIHARCRTTNPASRRVLEKCGFQCCGSGMFTCRSLRIAVSSDEFVLERFVWASLKRWGASQ